MHLLLPICGKFTRAQIAHQIFYCKFSRFRNFYTQKTSLERKKNSVCHAALPALLALPTLRPGVGRNLCRRYLSRLKGYRFEISATLRQLGWIDAPHTQNFEILEYLEQTQKSKKLKSVLNFL
jgi:hypothetical protein